MAKFSHFGTVKDAAARLRKTLKPKYPVYIIRRKLKDGTGHCILHERTKHRPKRFDIVICKTLQENTAVLLLVHEWAHTLTWSEKPIHGPKWGVAYAKCWNMLVENDEWH